jgi:hypothetical protein
MHKTRGFDDRNKSIERINGHKDRFGGKISVLNLFNQSFVSRWRNAHVSFEMSVKRGSGIEMTMLTKGFYGVVF